MQARRIALICALLSTSTFACNKGQETVQPDPATAEAETEDAPAEEPAPSEASPALVATYQGMVNDLYASDGARCLEDQMEAEGTRYMRAAYTLTITVNEKGVPTDATADEVAVQILNYEGQVLKDGNGEAMAGCLLEFVKSWEFEPLPPQATTFTATARVGD